MTADVKENSSLYLEDSITIPLSPSTASSHFIQLSALPAPPGRFYTPPEVDYDMPRASSRNPPFHCFFIELKNKPARHSFGETESSSKEQAVVDGNIPRDIIR